MNAPASDLPSADDTDIAALCRTQALLQGQTATLELVAKGAPLATVLNAIVGFIEGLSEGVIGSILLLDGGHLRHGACPNLPAAYVQAVDGSPVGPQAGSCGTAAYRRERVIVCDIATDPLWQDYAGLALAHGLRSCWSQPIIGAGGEVLGTFAFYKTEPASPAEWDFTLIDSATHLAGIAITRSRDDAERAQLVETLRAAVTAREDFLSVASHELNTPLTSLQLLIDRLRLRLAKRPLGPWLHEDVQAIDRHSRRLRILHDTLLDMPKLMAHHLQLHLAPTDAVGVVQEVMERLGGTAERAGITLQADLPERAVGRWDGARLDQIVTNLVSNALKFGAGKPVTVRLQADADTMRLTVTDQGIGIAEAEQSRLFHRFERLVSSQHYGGLGLGLWIVRQLVEALAGTVSVTSQPGCGSTFTVILPMGGPSSPDAVNSEPR